ncbi:MAG TPA: DUF2182 domain-containing protein [Gammaproteobacteria bacterium]|nr:DUF2182 domain-containing protein [Gammaproteobacteria bacterium]
MNEARVGRDHAVVAATLLILTALGWAALVRMNTDMSGTLPAARHGTAAFFAAVVMWLEMMVAMMAPATGPAVSAYIALARRRRAAKSSFCGAVFCSGYLAVWIGYGALAAGGQSALGRFSGFSGNDLSAIALIIAGLYQMTPLKQACIGRCRSPMLQLAMNWRNGVGGALRLGLAHGAWCVGCCWALMASMFVVGAANLIWMAALTLFVLGEKLAPARWRLDAAAGALLIAAGGGLLVS